MAAQADERVNAVVAEAVPEIAAALPDVKRPRSLRSLALGLTMVPQLGPLGATARYSGRALLAHQRGASLVAEVPTSRPTLRMASSIMLDETMLHGMALAGAFLSMAQYAEADWELAAADALFRQRGWVDDPGSYFQPVPEATTVRVTEAVTKKGPVELLSFPSGFAPRPDEPGRSRWLDYETNRTVYAGMLRHPGAPRPWLIALHGQGMGKRGDLDVLRMRRLHQEFGLNIIVPVLPLHGPRRRGLPLADAFVSITSPMNNVFGMAQSVWDLQRLIGWLRSQHQAESIGVFGFSLGSYVLSLLATREPDLSCVIAVAPGADLAGALRAKEPPSSSKRLAAHRAVHDERSALVHSVVSPLNQPCQVPVDRRFIIAGECDRVATPEGALALRRHWDDCEIAWQPSGHLMTLRTPGFGARLLGNLRTAGMIVDR